MTTRGVSSLLVISVYLCMAHTPHLGAQEWRLRAGYSYLWSPAWDQALEYYYMARPFLDGRKVYLQSGFDGGLTMIFEGRIAPYHGVELDYANSLARYRDSVFDQRLCFHLMTLGYLLHLRKTSRNDGFYGELGLGAAGALLMKNSRLPNEMLAYTEKAFGGGIRISAKAGWRISLVQGRLLPGLYLGASGMYLHIPRAERVLMQTQGVLLRDAQGLLMFQGGLTLGLR